jgi:predicted RNA-binding Zn ribbon-like protein
MRSAESSLAMQMKLEDEVGATTEELCIRFVNTVAWRLRDPQEERLPSAQELLAWLVDNGLCARRDASALQALWRGDDKRKAEFHATAIELREAIYVLLYSLIAEKRPPREALSRLNAWLAQPSPGIAAAHVHGTLRWQPSNTGGPRDMLKPIAISAASLMTGPRAGKIRQCSDNRGCGWLFIDESRALNRRWCSMGDCGNRAKAVRHRARKKDASVL